MRNAELWIGSAYDTIYFIKVGATLCGRPNVIINKIKYSNTE